MKRNNFKRLLKKIKSPILVTTISKPVRILYVNKQWISNIPFTSNKFIGKCISSLSLSEVDREEKSILTDKMLTIYQESPFGIIDKRFFFNNGCYNLEITKMIKISNTFMISLCKFSTIKKYSSSDPKNFNKIFYFLLFTQFSFMILISLLIWKILNTSPSKNGLININLSVFG